MISFNEELAKYRPILEMDDIEESIHATELQDILDMLQYISKKTRNSEQVHEKQMSINDDFSDKE